MKNKKSQSKNNSSKNMYLTLHNTKCLQLYEVHILAMFKVGITKKMLLTSNL